MTDPESFRIPLAVSAIERVCVACEAGFYRPAGGTITSGPPHRYLHECQTCQDVQIFDITYPQIDYKPMYDLDWTDKTIRETWKKERGIN